MEGYRSERARLYEVLRNGRGVVSWRLCSAVYVVRHGARDSLYKLVRYRMLMNERARLRSLKIAKLELQEIKRFIEVQAKSILTVRNKKAR